MAYTLGNKCAKNLSKRTVLLQLIIKNMVTFFLEHSVEWWGYMTVKKTEDMYNCLNRILACNGQTDGWMVILPRHSLRYAYASRSKNKTSTSHNKIHP